MQGDFSLGFRAELCSASLGEKTAHALHKQQFGKGRDEPSPEVLRGRAVLKLKWNIPPRRAGFRDVPLPTCFWPHFPTDRESGLQKQQD